jgi:MoaA/NifB/PqqE/SkfB family radical SAM enzyme
MVRRDKLHHLPERFPVACQWEITCRCNLHCVMCYTDCFNRPDFIREELTTSDMLRILDEMADAGTLELCLTGGEPMIRPDFFHLYEHAIRHGFLVTIFTNGTLITEAAADRFAALRPHRIEISLHGLTKDTFERITQGTGSYHRCLDGIKLLIDRQVPLTLKSTAMTLNQHEILAIKQYVASLGSVGYKLGEEMRPELDGGAGPFHYALSEGDLRILNQQDEDLWKESCQQSRTELSPCRRKNATLFRQSHAELRSTKRVVPGRLLRGHADVRVRMESACRIGTDAPDGVPCLKRDPYPRCSMANSAAWPMSVRCDKTASSKHNSSSPIAAICTAAIATPIPITARSSSPAN